MAKGGEWGFMVDFRKTKNIEITSPYASSCFPSCSRFDGAAALQHQNQGAPLSGATSL